MRKWEQVMISKIILLVLGVVSLVFGGWAGIAAFEDTSLPISTLGMGIPEDGRFVGIAIHIGFSALALLSWYLAKGPDRQRDAAVA
jgi:hypothetical protein